MAMNTLEVQTRQLRLNAAGLVGTGHQHKGQHSHTAKVRKRWAGPGNKADLHLYVTVQFLGDLGDPAVQLIHTSIQVYM